MKRWVNLAALATILGTGAAAAATDFPVTTQSSQSNSGRLRPLVGNGGIFLPWLNRHGNSTQMDAGIPRRNASRSAYGSGTRTTSRARRDSNIFFNQADIFRGAHR